MKYGRHGWSEVRKRGTLRFILNAGILRFGLPVAFIVVFLLPLLNNESVSSWSFINQIITFVVCSLIGGIFYGLILWCFYEHRYKKFSRRL